MPLTEKERQIVLTVVHRFLNLKEPSPHKLLIRQCKDPKAIEHLVSGVVLNSLGTPAVYLPRVLAFEYCGDLDALRRAKSAATDVVKVLQNLFEVELDKENFTPNDVYEQARKMHDSPPPRDDIGLGLFVVSEFANVLKIYGFDATRTELTTLQLSDNIVTLTDIDGMWDRHVRQYSVYLEHGSISLEGKTVTETVGRTTEETAATHRGLLVFISHSSKDAELALALIDILRAGLGLRADQIRCSSVDGYRLPVGVNTESQLRDEVNAAKTVIGLITPNSLDSYYVMFELGARWGTRLFLAPLLAGVKASELSGPLGLLNALLANNETQLHQLLENISKQLGLPLQGASSYVRHISAVKLLADSIKPSSSISVSPENPGAAIQKASNDGLVRVPPLLPPKSRSNIAFIESTSVTAHAGEPSNSTIYESPQQLGDCQISVLRFRNEAIVGQTVEQPSLTCHIVYKDKNGKEIADVPRAVWLDHYGESVVFDTGKRRSIAVFLLSNQGTLKKLWNESYFTSTSWMSGGPSYRIRHDGIRGDIASVEISLLSDASCVLRATFNLEGREEGRLPDLRLASISGE